MKDLAFIDFEKKGKKKDLLREEWTSEGWITQAGQGKAEIWYLDGFILRLPPGPTFAPFFPR